MLKGTQNKQEKFDLNVESMFSRKLGLGLLICQYYTDWIEEKRD